MKGRLLNNYEIKQLKNGTEVWIEDLEKEFEPSLHTLVDDKFRDKNDYWIYKDDETISVYEWIEDSKDEQTITKEPKELDRQKTYKGSEILAMIEDGKLKDNDTILDKDGLKYDFEDIKISCNVLDLLNLSPFTIKQKPVDYITAVNSGKKIRPVSLSTEKSLHPYTYWLGFMVSGLAHKESPLDLINGLWEIEY